LNAGFVVALGFFPVERPEGVSTAVKIAYHARFLVRIIGAGPPSQRLSAIAYYP
jgi:hypothetical protein